METLKNFLILRPAFTRLGLKILWFAFLLEFLIRLGSLLVGTVQMGNVGFGMWFTFLLFFVPSLLYLVLIRLLLEVAEFILFGARKN